MSGGVLPGAENTSSAMRRRFDFAPRVPMPAATCALAWECSLSSYAEPSVRFADIPAPA